MDDIDDSSDLGQVPRINLPDEVRANWFDPQRGFASFKLRIGVHVTGAFYLNCNDRGELWMLVQYPDGSLTVQDQAPSASPEVRSTSRHQWRAYGETFAHANSEFEADIEFSIERSPAAAIRVRWPDCKPEPVRRRSHPEPADDRAVPELNPPREYRGLGAVQAGPDLTLSASRVA